MIFCEKHGFAGTLQKGLQRQCPFPKGTGTGIYRGEQDALPHVYRIGATYTPGKKNHGRYQGLYERYRKLYPALKGL